MTVAAADEWAGCVAVGAKDAAADGTSPVEVAVGELAAAVAVVAAAAVEAAVAAEDVAQQGAECAAAEDAAGDHHPGDDWRDWCLTYGCQRPRMTKSPKSVWPTGCASGAATGCAGS